jgi:O-antigen/teichoic acid export membrane protein
MNFFLKDVVTYGFVNILEKLFPFLMLPLISHSFPLEEVGIYILFFAVLEITYPFLTLSLETVTSISYYSVSKRKFPIILINSFLLFIFYSILIIPISYGLFYFFERFHNLSNDYIILIIIIPFFRFYYQVKLILLQLQFKKLEYLYYSFSFTAIKSIIPFVLLIYNKINEIYYIIFFVAISYVVLGFFSLVSIINEFNLFKYIRINPVFFCDFLSTGFTTTIHLISSQIGNSGVKIIVNAVMGLTATSVYGVAATFGSFIMMADEVLNRAFYPHLFNLLKINSIDSKKEISRMIDRVYYIMFIVTFFVSLIAYFGMDKLYGNEYTFSFKFMPFILCAYMIKGLYKTHVNFLFYFGDTKTLSLISIVSAIIGLLFVWVGTLFFNLSGASIGLLVMVFLQYLLTRHFSKRHFG